MKKIHMKWLFALLVVCVPWLSAHALIAPPTAEGTYSFSITQGKVTVTPVFCIPEQCQEQSGAVAGTFDATIKGDQIRLSNIQVKSEVDFTLPEDPQTDRNGAVYDARFYFNGQELVLEGLIDSSAFDGPIVQYSLVAQVTGKPVAEFDPNGYYLARPDYRKCAAPMCGGIYVKQVNHRILRCPNGRASSECYIGTLDWQKIGVYPFASLSTTDNPILLKGTIDSSERYGRFVAEGAFAPAGKKAPSGTFYGVENNGIVCITSPCFSFNQYTLNSNRAGKISDLDLTRTGASEADIQAAYALMAESEPVLIAGVNQRVRQLAGTGIRLAASQFYLPIKATVPEECEEGYKPTERGCFTANGCEHPYLELATFPGVKPEDGRVAPTYSCVKSCDPPAELVSNGYCNLYLP